MVIMMCINQPTEQDPYINELLEKIKRLEHDLNLAKKVIKDHSMNELYKNKTNAMLVIEQLKEELKTGNKLTAQLTDKNRDYENIIKFLLKYHKERNYDPDIEFQIIEIEKEFENK